MFSVQELATNLHSRLINTVRNAMTKERNEKEYLDGDIIFREGDASSSAFMISSGQVELFKRSPKGSTNGRVRVAKLSAGEIVGEMGIVNRSARSATARAVGPVTLSVIERDGFLASLKEEPDVALQLIGNLAERLRTSDELAIGRNGLDTQAPKLATLSTGLSLATSGSLGVTLDREMTLWEATLSLFGKPQDKLRLLEFRVARLAGDEDGSQTKLLVRALSNKSEIRVKAYDEPLPVDTSGDRSASFLQMALATGRQWLAKDNADLLIWGDVNEVGTVIHLRFVTPDGAADHPGGFLISDRLALPTNFGQNFGKLLYAVTVAAVVPRTEAQRLLIKPLLLPALELAQEAERQPSHELLSRDQSTIQVCYSNMTALIGYYTGDQSRLRTALTAYQDVLASISRDTDEIAWANAQFHLCRIRQVLGEGESDPEMLENTAATFEKILDIFTFKNFPKEWGCIQSRIGGVFYRLDAIKSEMPLLKKSIAAYQSALHVFTKQDAPLKWSEVKNNLAQALQVWGGLAGSAKILERAILVCQEALQVRNRLETPMLWAATQNNLGAAFFLLGHLTEDTKQLESAADSFGKALEVYSLYGSAGLSRVTDRNMTKAKNLHNALLTSPASEAYWDEKNYKPQDGLVKPRLNQTIHNKVENRLQA
jgi:CRP-like cAMP-binding protein